MVDLYHQGHRELQEKFDTRRLADKANEMIVHDTISDEDREFIESRDMFFISTVDNRGLPSCSYKGGDPGFVRVVDEKTIAFPSYDGNGMFMSLGNILANNHVGILFIDFENPHRVRLHGTASVHDEDELLAEYHEAQLIVRVKVDNMFINCPRYIHRLKKIEHSVYIPKPGRESPIPDWKRLEPIQDVLPEKDRERISRLTE
ncbi:MAG: pyridoxamine 5'-phosphate oxidase family protein [Gammaproteobacteria bacterium]